MTDFYVYDREKFVKKTRFVSQKPEIIRGFLAAAHIQWKKNYDEGFYPSREKDFDLMNVEYKIRSGESYALRYRNLFFQFTSKDFLTGLSTYFETFRLKRPTFDIRYKKKQVYPFGDNPDYLSINEFQEMDWKEQRKIALKQSLILSDDFWIDLLKETNGPKIPYGVLPREWYCFQQYFKHHRNYREQRKDMAKYAQVSLIKFFYYQIKEGFSEEDIKELAVKYELYELSGSKTMNVRGTAEDKEKMTEACKKGAFLLVKLLWDQGVKATKQDAKLAADHGHLDLVKWLWEKGIRVEKGDDSKIKRFPDVVEFLRSQGFYNSKRDAARAAVNGKLDELKWLWERGIYTDEEAADEAATNGHFDVVKFMWDKGVHATSEGADWAADHNHFDIAMFLWENGVPATSEAANSAASNNRTDILKYLWKKGVSPTERGANWAAAHGNFDALKWLWDHEIYPDEDGANWAARNGHLNIVKWLWNHGIHANEVGAFHAKREKRLDVLKWLKDQGVEPDQ